MHHRDGKIMVQKIGKKNGKLVIYDPADPLSSYGVTPVEKQTVTQTVTTPQGQVTVKKQVYVEAETDKGKVKLPISEGVQQKIEEEGGLEQIYKEREEMRIREQARAYGQQLGTVAAEKKRRGIPTSQASRIIEEKRKDPCYGELRCWNHIQVQCPVFTECYLLAGGIRKCDRKYGKATFSDWKDPETERKLSGLVRQKVAVNRR